MRLNILKLISFYWFVFPETKRKHCLFKETCSKHVHRLVKEKELSIGILALLNRVKKCRIGYVLYLGNEGIEMKLADGTTINEEEISPNLLHGIYSLIKDHVNSTFKN